MDLIVPFKQSQQSQLDPLLDRLAVANQEFAARFPGLKAVRQPVHTVYGGANLYKPGTAQKIAALAQRHFSSYAPDYVRLAQAAIFWIEFHSRQSPTIINKKHRGLCGTQ